MRQLKFTVSIKTCKITVCCLVILVVWLGWMRCSLLSQVMTGAFISHQAVPLRQSIKSAAEAAPYSKSNDCLSGRDQVVYNLNWYINYYDNHSNQLAGSGVLGFVKTEREYVVRDAIACLRKTGTNDYGDDPYAWLKNEYSH